eukprot:scaffold36983_cov67-Phaeocystis_antarctica.AAC.4
MWLRKRWKDKPECSPSSGTWPVATKRTDGSTNEVLNWYAASVENMTSTNKLKVTMIHTILSTLSSLSSSASAEKSLMKAPPRKTHTSENCTAMARVFISSRLYGRTNWTSDRSERARWRAQDQPICR